MSVTGYTFGGWYLTSACTGSEVTTSTTFTQDTTVYAKWTATGVSEQVVDFTSPETRPSWMSVTNCSESSSGYLGISGSSSSITLNVDGTNMEVVIEYTSNANDRAPAVTYNGTTLNGGSSNRSKTVTFTLTSASSHTFTFGGKGRIEKITVRPVS